MTVGRFTAPRRNPWRWIRRAGSPGYGAIRAGPPMPGTAVCLRRGARPPARPGSKHGQRPAARVDPLHSAATTHSAWTHSVWADADRTLARAQEASGRAEERAGGRRSQRTNAARGRGMGTPPDGGGHGPGGRGGG